jgi:hypothetical protein
MEGVKRLAEVLPGLGEHVSADSSMIRSYANARREKRRRKEGKGKDPGARWGVKSGDKEKGKVYVFGHKLHLLVDSNYEVPLAFQVTSANAHDGHYLPGLLDMAEAVITPPKAERFVAADTAYDSRANCGTAWERGYIPLIPLNEGTVPQDQDLLDEKGMVCCAFTGRQFSYAGRDGNYTKWRCPYARNGRRRFCPKQHLCSQREYGETIKLNIRENPRLHAPLPRGTHRFRREYARRASVEHVFSRLKHSLAADSLTVMGEGKVRAHLILSLICYQAIVIFHYRQEERFKKAA